MKNRDGPDNISHMSQLSDRINDDVSDPKSVTVVIFLPWIESTFQRRSRYLIKIQNGSSYVNIIMVSNIQAQNINTFTFYLWI